MTLSEINPESKMHAEITHRIEIYKDRKGEFRSRIRSANGNVICDSGEGYKNAQDCREPLHRMIMALQNRTYVIEVEI